MRPGAVVLSLLIAAGTIEAQQLDPCRYIDLTIVSFTVDSRRYSSDSRVTCFSEYHNPQVGKFQARSWVVDETRNLTVGEDICVPCNGYYGAQSWVGAVSGVSTAGDCYRARVSGSSTFYSNEIGSARQCAPTPPPPSPDPQPRNCTPYWDVEGQTWVDEDCSTPILINLGSGGYQLSSAAAGVRFDIRDDGAPRETAWTLAGSEIAFLARDSNQNGAIDTGAELFGSSTRLLSGVRATNGFEALAELDTNGDHVIDRSDRTWPSLLLWTDTDHDGVSTADELRPASDGIRSLALSYRIVRRRDRWGNVFRYISDVELTSDRARHVYDVVLTSTAK